MELKPLFPTPLYWNAVDPKLADKIEQLFLSRLSDLPRENIHSTDFHAENKIIDLDKDLPDLKSEIMNNIQTFCEMTGISVTPSMQLTSWTQDYCKEADHHPIHSHGFDGVSVIYWIRANDKAGMTVFSSPNPFIRNAKRLRETDVTHGIFGLHPKKGTLVLWPAWLDHAVEPSKEGAVRSTLAFNLCE